MPVPATGIIGPRLISRPARPLAAKIWAERHRHLCQRWVLMLVPVDAEIQQLSPVAGYAFVPGVAEDRAHLEDDFEGKKDAQCKYNSRLGTRQESASTTCLIVELLLA